MELNIRLNKNTGEFNFDKLANIFDVGLLKEYGFESYELGQGYDDIDYSVLEEMDMKDVLQDKESGVKQAIQIEFNSEDYNEAKELVKQARKEGKYIGGLLIKSLK